jgi:hypothetical protein
MSERPIPECFCLQNAEIKAFKYIMLVILFKF